MSLTGGKNVYGASVGILMLESRFPRAPGDMGNAGTWPFPVQYRVVRDATPDRVVRHRAAGLVDGFIDAARDLVAHGVDGITTTCGFLSLFQKDIAAAVGVPVATSSLMQYPMIQAVLPPGKRVGILTISKASLVAEHLSAAGVPVDVAVAGTDGGREFTRVVLDDEPSLDFDLARNDLLQAAADLIAGDADIGAILLECTNMVPFATDIRSRTGLPVYSIYSFVTWFQAGLLPRRFAEVIDDSRL